MVSIKKNLKNSLKAYLGGMYFDVFLRDYCLEGMQFYVPREITTRKFRSRFLLNEYETDIERIYLHKYLPSESCVLELGGCLGIMSCVANRLLSNRGWHVVVEPHPKILPSLQLNRDRNNCEFIIERGVVSNKTAVKFFLHDLIVGGSVSRPTSSSTTVEGFTIAELKRRHRLNFDVLLCDIEGGEVELLKEHHHDLADFKWIFMELHDRADFPNAREIQEVPKMLESLGFELVDEDRRITPQQVWRRVR